MKYARTLRILGIAIILSLLMAAIPAMPALAYSYDIEIDPDEGAIGDGISDSGDEITITGDDFTPSTDSTERWARIYFVQDEADEGDVIDTDIKTYERVESEYIGDYGTADAGEFETTFEVPAELNDGSVDREVTPGIYYVCVAVETTGGISPIRAVATFTVIGGEISLYPLKGPVDTPVEISGTDFAADTAITIEYDNYEIDRRDIEGDIETRSNGYFESIIYIPESTAGDHTITVIVGTVEVEAEFTVEPDILIAPQSGEAGTDVTVSGTGFARRPKEVNIYFNNDPVVIAAPLDTKGSFVAKFFIPDGLSARSYTIEAEDDDRNIATAPFTLTVPPPPEPTPEPTPAPTPTPTPSPSPTTLSISQESGYIGTQLMMGGAGFAANGTVTIKYDDEVVATSTADASGIFVATFKVPASKHGDHTITASDGTNTNEVTFTVESVALATPQPLVPELGVKVKSPISFDWEDVTVESPPATYALQIATDEDFTDDSIILDKTELAESEYILTEEEELELASQETPYYWRIRTVDAASNEGEWTGAGEFYVTAPFAFPSWALYTLLGIGAVLIFAIGYWLGRRTAFYY